MANYNKPIPIYAGGRVVGTVKGKTFTKKIKESGFLKTPLSIAYSIDSLDQAKRAGAKILECIDERGCKYTASFETIYRYGFEINRGYGEQRALPIDYWDISRGGVYSKHMQYPLQI